MKNELTKNFNAEAKIAVLVLWLFMSLPMLCLWLHFTLGPWIRNHWLYPQSEEEREALLMDFGQGAMFCHPDDDSTVILETYRKYLKRRKV